MKTIRITVVCIALWCAMSTAHGEQLTTSDVAAIEALASGYSKWALAGDFQQWAELYHPDAIRMNPGQPALEGKEAIYQWANSIGLVAGQSKHEMTVTEIEGTRDIAFIRGLYRAELVLRIDGEEVALPPDEGSWIAVVRRDQHDAWRFYRFIANTDLLPQRDTEPAESP